MNPMRTSLVIAIVLVMGAVFAVGESLPQKKDKVELKNPHHPFEEDCGLCHTAESWVPVTVSEEFNHAEYGFALNGAHGQTPCGDCHHSLVFSEQLSLCIDCHQDVHENELGTDCSRCHTTRSFIEYSRMRREHQVTRFPLTGVHLTLDCQTCHLAGQQGNLMFVNTPVDCEFCHLDEALATTSPDHQANGFTNDCGQCHGTAGWIPAGFGHTNTGFPLTGAHRGLGCSDCHGDTFNKVPSDCVACHRDDYDGTRDPDHVAVGFPVECQICHSTVAWEPADIEHNGFFPIDSGAHQGQWDKCSDCHINPGNFTDFTCLPCHPHSDQLKTDGDHSEVQNYQYESRACFNCHPRGRS
jgi:Zn finger protein HypA/HybF involved in hydrogenase expression